MSFRASRGLRAERLYALLAGLPLVAAYWGFLKIVGVGHGPREALA